MQKRMSAATFQEIVLHQNRQQATFDLPPIACPSPGLIHGLPNVPVIAARFYPGGCETIEALVSVSGQLHPSQGTIAPK